MLSNLLHRLQKVKMKKQGLPLRFSSILASRWSVKEQMNQSREAIPTSAKIQKRGSLQQQAQGLQIIEQLFKTTTSGYYKDFASTFIYGVDMKIWRKGRMKDVVVFTDSNMPNLLWIATKTKTFLFDLVYTNLENSDVQLQLSQQIHYYFVLLYFEEKIPFVFEDFQTFKKTRTLFHSAIFQHQTQRPEYPPYLSKLIKYCTVSQLSEENKKVNSVGELLRIAESLVGQGKRLLYEEILKQMTQQKVTNKHSDQSFYELCLNAEEMMQFFKVSCCNENLKAIYEYYCGVALSKKSEYVSSLMTSNQFCNFLVKEQSQTEEQAEKITKKHFDTSLSFYEFCNFLSNKQYNYLALNPPLDENLPLNQYFCYSSHNTYLSGNQITSDSKVQRYLQDLRNGLKCLQIDVHNSGENLIVTHALNGLYLNKQVSFEEVVKEIANYCKQKTNFYPIILSIQNRASKESYFKIANIFQTHLGTYLLDLSECHKNNSLKCHTLAELRNKVIVKTDSKIKDLLQLQKKRQTHRIIPTQKRQKIDSINNSFNNKQQQFQQKVRNFQDRKSFFENQFKESYYLPSDQITRVTALFKSQDGVNNQNSVGYESTSVTSKKLQQFDYNKIVEYTKRSFLRIYPLGTEINSGNYNPIPALERGAQIIALNTQTKDNYAWLMMSYFTAGVTQPPEMIGYIAKPSHLRTGNAKQKIIQVISISILSTFFNTKIKFYGTTSDMKKNEGNSLNFQIEDFEAGFLMFEMQNGLKDCIPTRFIREGYRVIVGRNNNYVDCGVRVLLRVKIKYLSISRLSLHLN